MEKAGEKKQESQLKIEQSSMSKSKWKKQVKEKTGNSIEENTKQEMIYKTTTRIIVEDKWERKKYIQECDSDTKKDMVKKDCIYGKKFQT